ncbi:MAG: hypothetical protein COB98_03600 [Flavobacteriaceae bacterium]|nr:MAG: hypothetical protein COB98_03600 [Flavobacteriaceae bacterium]
MKIIYIPIILSCLLCISCHKKSELAQLLDCDVLENTVLNKESTDFNKTFSILTSKHWKTNLYYDNFQSSIMTADTTKSLSKTFIFEAALYHGDLSFTEKFNASIKVKLVEKKLELVQENYFNWQEKPAYYILVKGMKNKRNYQELTIYINHSSHAYLKAQTQVYGDINIQERLCSSLQLFNTLKIK